MFGYTEEEFLRIGVTDIHPKESLDLVLAEFEAQARGEKLLSPGLPCLRKDGALFYANVSAIMTVLDDRKCNVGIFSDVTEYKRAQEALRESEERTRLIVETAHDAFISGDTSGAITAWNAQAEKTFGWAAAEAIGRRISETIIPPRHRQAHTRGLNHFLATGEGPVLNKSVEITALHRDGHEFPAELAVWVVGSGETSTFNAFVRDITERKQAEEERERLQAELEVRAITDGLTGLYNHAHFVQRLAEETERSKRYNHGFAVLMIDVDNFKGFNDSRGHQAGDEMLRLVADSIQSGLRRSDLAFRYGGDEFAAILLHADAARARAVIDRINRRLAKGLKQMNDEAASRVSLSAGVACFAGDGEAPDELVRVADAALYSAKWAARARDVMEEGYAVESLAPAAATLETGVLSTQASSLAAALSELGVPDALAELNLRAIAALGTLAEVKDPYIRGHQERTSEVAASVAEEMGLSSDRVRGTRLAGLLHDLGKAGISKRILNKPGKLTEEEFAEIKEHPPLGSMMIISEIEALQQVVPIVRHHHEHFDGRGYPDGLAGQDIPLEARILGVVDAFDAMTHERSYRKAMSREEALAELERGAGTQFDAAVVEAFLAWASREGAEPEARKQPASEDKELATVRTTKT
jgi:diguanylate cyclase (GGDEF)-like protein/PAS domain S-box-containing protein